MPVMSQKIAHNCLSELLKLEHTSKFKCSFVSLAEGRSLSNTFLNKIQFKLIRQAFYQGSIHLSVALKLLRKQRCDRIIIMEFLPCHMYLAAILIKCSKTPVMFIMHGVQQLASCSKVHSLALSYFKLFNFETIQFEIDDRVLPSQYRLNPRRNLVIPIPIEHRGNFALLPGQRFVSNKKIVLGIIGMFRTGKPLSRLAKIVHQSIKDDELNECELVLGTPLWHYDGSMNDTGLAVKDTTALADYYGLLQSVDVAIYLFDENDYYYRPSGTIVDAASCGAHIVCNELPVISHQINFPVVIGTTFKDESEISLAIRRAIDHRRTYGQDNHYISRENRNINSITTMFNEFLTKRGHQPHENNVAKHS